MSQIKTVGTGTQSLPVELSDLFEAGAVVVGETGKRFRGLGSVSTRNNLVTLATLFQERHPAFTLEIGLCFGASCCLFAEQHRNAGRPPVQQHVAIDPFQTTLWDNAGIMRLRRLGLEDYVEAISDFSSVALPRLHAEGKRFDFIYVDGSHLFEDAFVDFYYCWKLLPVGGIIFFDDATTPDIRKIVRFIRRNLHMSFVELDLSGYRERRGGTIYRIAKYLNRVQLIGFQKAADATRSWNAQLINF